MQLAIREGSALCLAGLKEAPGRPASISPVPLCRLVVCRLQGWGRGAHNLWVWGEGSGQQGQGLREVGNQPLPPLYMGGSLQSTISRSFR